MTVPSTTRQSVWLSRRHGVPNRTALQLCVNLAKEDFERCLSLLRLGVEQLPVSRCSVCHGTGADRGHLHKLIGDWANRLLDCRPSPDSAFDQAPVGVEQVLDDTAFILERLSDESRFLFIGDDDHHSLVLAKAAPWLEVVVLEADERVVTSLNVLAEQEGLRVSATLYNANDPLPRTIAGECDAFFTDPPYSPYGVHLFAQRGIEALGDSLGAWGLMALPMTSLPPEVRVMIRRFQEYVIGNGFAILDVLPACKVSPNPKGIVSGLLRFERVSAARCPVPQFAPESLYEHFY